MHANWRCVVHILEQCRGQFTKFRDTAVECGGGFRAMQRTIYQVPRPCSRVQCGGWLASGTSLACLRTPITPSDAASL